MLLAAVLVVALGAGTLEASQPLVFDDALSLKYLYYAYAAFCLPNQVGLRDICVVRKN